MLLILSLSFITSFLAYFFTYRILPSSSKLLLQKGLKGIDHGKRDPTPIPEATGVISGAVFLFSLLLFLPIPFIHHFIEDYSKFSFDELTQHVKGLKSVGIELFSVWSALVSITSTLALGFVDDMRDLPWRHKLIYPTFSSFPLLIVYFFTYNATTVIVPWPFRSILGNDITLGPLYYVYMGMMVVFCTNAINIYAGINGLEVGQSLVIAASILTFNIVELSGDCWRVHLFSFYFVAPFFATSLALFQYNKYPATMFVGDTFCYYAGMTFAVVGILGHFSKTMMLFFIPQVFNFLFSLPQLFHLVPCPRHRLPRYNSKIDKVDMSFTIFKKKDLKPLGKIILMAFRTFRLVHYEEITKDGEVYIQCSNFTLIILTLKFLGPLHERTLTHVLLTLQILSSGLAFFIRYGLVKIFYEA